MYEIFWFSNLMQRSNFLENFFQFNAKVLLVIFSNLMQRSISSDQLNLAWLSSAQIDIMKLLDFWMESVASERRPIVQILLKFFIMYSKNQDFHLL